MTRLHFDCRHRYASGFELHAAFATSAGVTALFGASGSGKSTILSLIAGVLHSADGIIRLGDRVLLDTRQGINLRPERRRIGIVFQDHLLFPHLTIRRNLSYGAHHRQRADADMIAGGDFHPPLQQVADLLELTELLDRLPQQLSGGQRQRVALGRALLSGPELLLMDEPLGGLDAPMKDRILEYLERVLRQWRLPTIFVSHDQADVRRLADGVVIVEKGEIAAAGKMPDTLDQIAAAGQTEAAGRRGPMNLLRIEANARPMIAIIGGQKVHLPEGISRAAHAYVQFSPSDVALSRRPVTGLSIRNQLHGRVVAMVPQQSEGNARESSELVFVEVEIGPGARLWAEITREAAKELQLAGGADVICLIKTSAMRLM